VENSFRHVLVVDDEPDSLRLLGRLLAQEGYLVHAADSGERALEIAERTAGEVRLDLILLDILMPGGLDGMETCRRLKALPATRDTPIIFLTGKTDTLTTVKSFEAGGADFVPKPFDARILLARVRTHIEFGLLSRHLDQALTERTQELLEANAQLRRLALEIAASEEEERRQLADRLHDSPLQILALAQMQLDSAARDRDEESWTRLDAGRELLRQAQRELRTLQFDLSPPVLHKQGLAAALEWLASQTTHQHGLPVTLEFRGKGRPIALNLARFLFQSARELLHNVLKHADASQAELLLESDELRVMLAVRDDGRGFASAQPAATQGGYGLQRLRERLELLDGSLEIHSRPGETLAEVRVPLALGKSV